MDLWSFLNSLTVEERLWLLAWFLLGIIPFIIAALVIKKKLKVGKIDIHAFSTYFLFILIVAFMVLDSFAGNEFTINLFINLADFLIGFILLIVIFNRISEGIRKTYLIEIQIEKFNLNIHPGYTYEYKNKLCVIRLDEEGHESFKEMWQRLKGKRTYLECEGAHFHFTEKYVNQCYLCTSCEHKKEIIEVDGEEIRADVIRVIPIPTTEFSELEFLVNFKSFDRLNTRLAELYTQKLEMEGDIFVLAIDLFRNWAEIAESAEFGENRPSVQDVIAKYAEAKRQIETNRQSQKEAEKQSKKSEKEEFIPQDELEAHTNRKALSQESEATSEGEE